VTGFLPLTVLLTCPGQASAPSRLSPVPARPCGGADERSPGIPGAVQPPPLFKPEPRNRRSLLHRVLRGATGPDRSLAGYTARARACRGPLKGEHLTCRSPLCLIGCRGRAARGKWCAAASQGGSDLCAQSWQRTAEGGHLRSADLLAADASRLRPASEPNAAADGAAFALRSTELALGRSRRPAACTLGFSARPWPQRSGSRAFLSAAAAEWAATSSLHGPTFTSSALQPASGADWISAPAARSVCRAPAEPSVQCPTGASGTTRVSDVYATPILGPFPGRAAADDADGRARASGRFRR
jgi:hypothetical protein